MFSSNRSLALALSEYWSSLFGFFCVFFRVDLLDEGPRIFLDIR